MLVPATMNRTIITLPDHCDAIALCGGPYSNFAAVEAFLATTSGLPRFCLGDLGGPGRYPDRTIARVRESYVVCMQGNYDHAIGHAQRDCGCGYVDPQDREYAQISYDYTAANTSEANKAWLRSLPGQILLEWRGKRILLVHGSPDSVNEFVWDSETDDARIDAWLADENVHAICATHSGLPWVRATQRGFWCNVGVLGRPAHDATPRVGYALLHFGSRRDDADPEPRAARLRRRAGRRSDPRRGPARRVRAGAGTRRMDHLLQHPAPGRATAGGPLRGASRPLLDPDVPCTRRCPCSSRLTSPRSSATRSIRCR